MGKIRGAATFPGYPQIIFYGSVKSSGCHYPNGSTIRLKKFKIEIQAAQHSLKQQGAPNQLYLSGGMVFAVIFIDNMFELVNVGQDVVLFGIGEGAGHGTRNRDITERARNAGQGLGDHAGAVKQKVEL